MQKNDDWVAWLILIFVVGAVFCFGLATGMVWMEPEVTIYTDSRVKTGEWEVTWRGSEKENSGYSAIWASPKDGKKLEGILRNEFKTKLFAIPDR